MHQVQDTMLFVSYVVIYRLHPDTNQGQQFLQVISLPAPNHYKEQYSKINTLPLKSTKQGNRVIQPVGNLDAKGKSMPFFQAALAWTCLVLNSPWTGSSGTSGSTENLGW